MRTWLMQRFRTSLVCKRFGRAERRRDAGRSLDRGRCGAMDFDQPTIQGVTASRRHQPRRISSLLTALGALIFLTTSLHAADPSPPPDPAAHTVFIPFDQTQPVKNQKAQRYYLDRADFERLWSLAKENRKPAKVTDKDDEKPEAVLQSALYRASIEDERLVIEAQFQVTTRGHWASARLGLATAARGPVLPLRDLVVDGKPGAMANGEVSFEQPGQHVVQATFDLVRERHWKQAALSLPSAQAAMLSLKLAEQDTLPRFTNATLVAVEEAVAGARVVTVGLGSAEALSFDRVQRRPVSAALPPSAEVRVTTALTGEMRLRAAIQARFAFPGASRKEVVLLIDPDWTLDAAPQVTSGNQTLRDARVSLRNEAATQALVASFPHDVSDEVTLEFRLTPKSLSPAHTPFVAPLAAHWETTAVLEMQEGAQIIAKPTAAQQRLSVTSYRLGATDTLAFDIKPADDKTEARVDYVYQLSEQKQEVAAAIALKRERGAWRQLRVGLPPGMEIQSVQSPNVIAWELQGSELFLRFNDLTGNQARVVILVANTVLKASKTWMLAPLKLSDIGKVQGTAIIAAHAATEARLDGFKREHDLREIDPANLTATFTITAPLEKKRAIEFERAGWTLNVSLEDLATRFSADGILLVQATDLGVLVSQQVSLNVEQGALKRLVLRLPKALPEATVTGEQLREVQSRVVGGLREYECTFQSQGGLLGHTALTFEMQLPLTDAELPIPFVEISDVERLRRYFVLDNSSSRESKTLQKDGVDACAKDALPYVPEVLTQPQFYQGRSSGGLRVAYTQLQATSGNAAVVTLADITTVLRADGERWDTVVYSLSNRSLQFLPVILPDKAELMAVTVSGEAVRADEEKNGQGQRVRLIPLIQTRPGERSMEVRLVYRIKGGTLGRQIKLDDPDLVGISAERTVWTASLPKGWTIDDTLRDTFGNMEPIAEEGRDIEKLQSWMSDLGRINRAVSGSKDAEFNNAALIEAEKLNKQIADLTQQVENKSRSRYSFYRDGGKEAKPSEKLAYQVEGDLSKVKEELGRQEVVLKDNRVNQGNLSFSQSRQFLGNTWCANGVQGVSKLGKADMNQSYAEYQTLNAVAQRLTSAAQDPFLTPDKRAQAQAKAKAQAEKVQAMEQEMRRQSAATLGLNDNVAVNNAFFTGDLALGSGAVTFGGTIAYSAGTAVNGVAHDALGNPTEVTINGGTTLDMNGTSRVISGTISGTAGGLVKSGAGTLTLSGGNTYTGATTITAGKLQVADGTPIAVGTLSGVVSGTDFPQTTGSLTLGQATGSSSFDSAPTGQFGALNSNARAYANFQGQAGVISTSGTTFAVNGAARPASPLGGAFAPGAIVSPKQEGIVSETLSASLREAPAATRAPAEPVITDSVLPPPSLRSKDKAAAIIAEDAQKARKQMGMPGLAAEAPPPAPMPAAAPAAAADPFAKSGSNPADTGSLGLATQAVNQLRPTGRRSLQVEVPLTGEVFHFRKLKDHAVLDLALKHPWPEEKKSQATVFGLGLGVWCLLAWFASRRRRRSLRAITSTPRSAPH